MAVGVEEALSNLPQIFVGVLKEPSEFFELLLSSRGNVGSAGHVNAFGLDEQRYSPSLLIYKFTEGSEA